MFRNRNFVEAPFWRHALIMTLLIPSMGLAHTILVPTVLPQAILVNVFVFASSDIF
jgi:hypothetical protein